MCTTRHCQYALVVVHCWLICGRPVLLSAIQIQLQQDGNSRAHKFSVDTWLENIHQLFKPEKVHVIVNDF
jgi:hypothetical protein